MARRVHVLDLYGTYLSTCYYRGSKGRLTQETIKFQVTFSILGWSRIESQVHQKTGNYTAPGED